MKPVSDPPVIALPAQASLCDAMVSLAGIKASQSDASPGLNSGSNPLVDSRHMESIPCVGVLRGGDRIRTDDLMRAKHIFYHLNYTPKAVTNQVFKPGVQGFQTSSANSTVKALHCHAMHASCIPYFICVTSKASHARLCLASDAETEPLQMCAHLKRRR